MVTRSPISTYWAGNTRAFFKKHTTYTQNSQKFLGLRQQNCAANPKAVGKTSMSSATATMAAASVTESEYAIGIDLGA